MAIEPGSEQSAQGPLTRAHLEGSRLAFKSGAATSGVDATALIAALLVVAAKGDGSISQSETAEMLEIMSSRLETGNAKAMEHLSSAVMNFANEKDLAVRLRGIAQGLSEDEKATVFSMVLDLAGVDGEIHPGEVEAAALAGQILGLSQDAIYSELRELVKP